MRFKYLASGEWEQPIRRGYKLMCCDCGLVHRLNFRLRKDSLGRATIEFRGNRDERSTALARRAKPKRLREALKA